MQQRTEYAVNGSTLAEILVMMIVSGILLLCIMDGVMLFTRTQLQRTTQIQAISRITNGYYRIESLISTSDSIRKQTEGLSLFRNGSQAKLILKDSALLYTAEEFCDTLLSGIGRVWLITPAPPKQDTVSINLRTGKTFITIKFATPIEPVAIYEQDLKRIEQGCDYEE